jgi:hypothetical protein
MIAKIVRIASLTLATTLALAAATSAQPVRPATACSNATFTGTYGISFGGIDSHGRLRAAVAQITTDGKGKFTGVESESKGGVIHSVVPVTGTYAVKANCTGSGSWLPQGGKVRHYNLVVVSGGGGAELIQTDTGHTESGFAQAQGTPTCTNAGVKGTFGFHAAGSFVGVGPAAFIGQFKLDGAGNVAGNESGSVNGTILNGVPLSGTYTVNSDCTGTATVTPQGQTAVNLNLVVVGGGSKVLALETDANSIVSGSIQK